MLPNGKPHKVAVIPARISDNKVLMQKDPGYVDRLQLVGGPKLVKAWIEGDWTAVEAAFFDCWSEARHVLRPVDLPRDWIRYRSGGLGLGEPVRDLLVGGGAGRIHISTMAPMLPWCGALIAYREWYGTADPGGVRTARPQADGSGGRSGYPTRAQRSDPGLRRARPVSIFRGRRTLSSRGDRTMELIRAKRSRSVRPIISG